MSMPPAAETEMVPLEIPWYAYAGIGAIFVLLGVVGLGMTFALTMYSILMGGILLVVGGVSQIVSGFTTRIGSGALLHMACGLLYLLAGVFAISDPELASVVLTLLLSVSLLVTGMTRMVLAFLHRRVLSWLAVFVSGLITLLVGVFVLNRWPWDSAWVIGLFFAIDLISQGMSWLALGFHIRAAGMRGV
jgi:uncharacterized membrane protein HdeD (DUF308 family)